MLLKYFYDEKLAQASYLVGCAKTGEALVVDPMRNVTPYLRAAEKEGLRITHVTETHIHADFVSGSRELAAATGATIYLSDMGDADWKYAYADDPNVILVRDGDYLDGGQHQGGRAAHAGPHARAHCLPDHRHGRRPTGPSASSPATSCLWATSAGPTCWKRRPATRAPRKSGARQQYQTVQRFKEHARLSADLAGPRRRQRLRQGVGRHSVDHAGLRKALQPGLPACRRGALLCAGCWTASRSRPSTSPR